MSGEKTEKPTGKRLKQAKDEGNTPRTADLSAWLCTAAGALLLPMAIDSGEELGRSLFALVPAVAADPEPARALVSLTTGFKGVPLVVAPVAAATVLAAVVAGAMQGGLHLAPKRLKPKFSTLNPISGIKQHYGPHALWELAKSLAKVGVLGLVLWSVLRGLAPHLVAAGVMPLEGVLSATGDAIGSLLRIVVFLGLVIAGADYAMSRRKVMKSLRMSKEDIKQEYKNAEGDPLLKGAIKSKQLAMSRNRMMADVADADVVVVNPTHIAVALRYDPAKGAPRVVAKGAGAIADKIREKAREHDVPLVRDIPLARTMYKDVKVGQEVPADLYAAVAKVLAFVMSLRTRGSLLSGGEPLTVPS
ncbi:EscU/YscU/HrcU family type III secretion system export apparatus switch protein [Kineococcus glutinatus]|uniref:Flagellar biosynthesis protein FlhB n=1 Tax=Kineococcus glutinatus TaxID=1070872 RepID=A0ABP9I3U6_9ACTN